MQEQVTTRPLVDILSEQTGRTIVMRGDAYLYFDTFQEVESVHVQNALDQQKKELTDILKEEMTKVIEKMVNLKAVSLRWDDIKSARAGAGVPLDGTETDEELRIHSEAVALAKWDRSIWAKAALIEKDVLNQSRAMPTEEELLSELPVFGE